MTLVTITGNTIREAGTRKDNRPWGMRSVAYQYGGGTGGVVTTGADWQVLQPVAGILTFTAEAGIATFLRTPDNHEYLVRIPEEDAGLWDVIEAGIAFPPNTAQDRLDAAVAQYVETNRSDFRTRAVLITEGEDAGKAQWVDESDVPTGDPVEWSQVVSEDIASIAAAAAAADAINTDLAARNFTWEDAGGGEGYPALGGVPLGDAVPWPATTVSGIGGAGTAGKAALAGETESDVRDAISAVGNLDVRLDDSRPTIDGSVTVAKLDATLAAAHGSPHLVTNTDGGTLNSTNDTDATTKQSRLGVGHYTNAENPFYAMFMASNSSDNIVNVGGGTSLGNAATQIYLSTGADNTTPTGTIRTHINTAGAMNHYGNLNVGDSVAAQRTITFNASAGQYRIFEFQSDGTARWHIRVNNVAETGSDAGSNLQIVPRTDAGGSNPAALEINRASGVVTLRHQLETKDSDSDSASLRLPHGSAPSSPDDGAMWTTTSGLFVRINGTTYQVDLT